MDRSVQILLVEDSPADVRLCQEALKGSPITYNLHVVTNGEDALEFLRLYTASKVPRPDVILLDLNLPKKPGHDVLAELKKDPDIKGIPVVVLTVSQDEEDIMRAIESKMDYYIRKPVTSQNLIAVFNMIEGLC